MTGHPASQCESCGAPIRWETTAAKGKAIPLNTSPDERGNIVVRAGRTVVLSKHVGPEDGETRYTAHFATCPNAPGWRRRKD